MGHEANGISMQNGAGNGNGNGSGPASTRLRVLHVYKDVFPPVVGGVERQIDLLRRGMPDVESKVVVCARAPRTSHSEVRGATEVKVAEFGPRWLSMPVAPT